MHPFMDSKLVANQVKGSYEARGEKTKKLKEKVLEMIQCFDSFRISHIPREENKKADALSKLAAVYYERLTKGVLTKKLNERSVDMAEVNTIVKEAARTWMTPIQEYIKKGILSEDATATRTISEKVRNYVMEDVVLYQKSYLGTIAMMHRPITSEERVAWVEELPNVLWAYRTTPKTSNRETPFSLAYWTEIVIPAEIGMPIRRTIQKLDEENDEALRMNPNLLEERREITTIRKARRKR
nr:reverse transcriptase domain-containing protein [Tanacetum cinerariifolium]